MEGPAQVVTGKSVEGPDTLFPMQREVDVAEFERQAHGLLSVIEEGGSVLVTRQGEAVAVLTSPSAVPSLPVTMDLPRWEEWLHEMRESFPRAGGGRPALRVPLPEPPTVDKTLLGFDPVSGRVGSPQGREFLAAELVRLRVPLRDDKLLDQVYAAALRLCEDKERVYEEDVRVIAQETVAQAPRGLRLLSCTVTSSTGLPATAEVTLELVHGPAMRREMGDGPLDAAFKAIQRLTQLEPQVENFSVVAATPGRDAVAEAVIELLHEGRRAVGAGVSTNAIEAGVHAYVNALNFLLES